MKIIAPYMSCVVNAGFGDDTSDFDYAVAEGYQKIYVITSKGPVLHHKLKPGKGGANRFVQIPVASVPAAAETREFPPTVNFLPDGKIPWKIILTVQKFFNEVIKVKGRAVEAMIWIMWNEEKGYFLHVPDQRVGGASANYDWKDLPPNSSIIVDIHSHADFGAFFSGTDDGDDSNVIRFSGVLGHNNTPNPSHKWRFIYDKTRFDVNITDLFEVPAMTVGTSPVTQEVDASPKEWIDKVVVTGPVYNRHASAQGYQGYQGRHSFYPGAHGKATTPTTSTAHLSKREKKLLKRQQMTQEAASGSDNKFDAERAFYARLMGGQADLLDIPDDDLGFGHEGYVHPMSHGSAGDQADAQDKELAKVIQGLNQSQAQEAAARRSRAEDLLSESTAEAIRKHHAVVTKGTELTGQSPEDKMRDRAEKDAVAAMRQEEEEANAELFESTFAGFSTNIEQVTVEYGAEIAEAFQDLEEASFVLFSDTTADLVEDVLEAWFLAVDDDKKLDVFRRMANILPEKAKMKLAEQGL